MPSKTSPRLLATQQRRAIAVSLRTRGATYAQIYQVLRSQYGHLLPPHYNIRRAYEDVSRAMSELRRQIAEDVETVRCMELERIDELQLSVWHRAVQGDVEAINTILRLMARRSTLLGLDTPLKIARTTPTGQPVTSPRQGDEAITLEELAAMLAAHQSPQERGDDHDAICT